LTGHARGQLERSDCIQPDELRLHALDYRCSMTAVALPLTTGSRREAVA